MGSPNASSGLVDNKFSNPDVTSVYWKSVDDSNPVLELNVESSLSVRVDNEHYSFFDTVLQYVVWLKISNPSIGGEHPLNEIFSPRTAD